MAQDQAEQPVNPSKLSTINLVIFQLSLLLSDLLAAARATADPVRLMQINNEYAAVQTCMNQAVQAQVAANDTLFNQATTFLKTQSSVLEGMEAQIVKIVDDTALVGRIVGYIVQVVTLLAKL